MGYFQEFLPWPILAACSLGSSLILFIYSISVWRRNHKVLASGSFLWGFSSVLLGMYYMSLGFKNNQQFISESVLYFSFALSTLIILIGGFLKLKKEDKKRLKHFLIFTGTCFIIMISLLIYINIYS